MEKIKNFLEKLPPCTLTLICLAAILWLTLASEPLGDNDIQLFPHADKLVHAIMFGGFALCIILDWVRKRNWLGCTRNVAVLAAISSIVLGIMTEIGQQAMHIGRSGDPIDLVADSIGAILFAAAMFYATR